MNRGENLIRFVRYRRLDWFAGGAWQCPDDDHPTTEGEPGYRLVHKSLRMVVYPPVVLTWPNLRIFIGFGDVNRGGMRLGDALPDRLPGRHLLPEYGSLVTDGNQIVYREQVNMNYKFQGWEETLTGTGHVEFLLRTESSEPIEMRSEGRASLARMKLLMTFLFGDRLLGPVLTEEIGRIFPDWHWNREIGTEAVAAESQLDTHQLSGDEIVSQLQLLIDSEQSLVETDQRRLALAAHWYWMAMSDASTVNRFLQLWIVLEALEMAAESRANLRAVRHRLANLCG